MASRIDKLMCRIFGHTPRNFLCTRCAVLCKHENVAKMLAEKWSQ